MRRGWCGKSSGFERKRRSSSGGISGSEKGRQSVPGPKKSIVRSVGGGGKPATDSSASALCHCGRLPLLLDDSRTAVVLCAIAFALLRFRAVGPNFLISRMIQHPRLPILPLLLGQYPAIWTVSLCRWRSRPWSGFGFAVRPVSTRDEF